MGYFGAYIRFDQTPIPGDLGFCAFTCIFLFAHIIVNVVVVVSLPGQLAAQKLLVVWHTRVQGTMPRFG